MLMSSFLTTTMLDREIAVTQEFLQSIIATEGYGERVFAADDGHASEALKEFADHLRAMPEILRANLYSTDRRIIWSSDQSLTGRRFENNPELEQALAGTLVSEVSRLEGNDKPEHVALAAGATGYFIEAYLPMWRGANGRRRRRAIQDAYSARGGDQPRGSNYRGIGRARRAGTVRDTLLDRPARSAPDPATTGGPSPHGCACRGRPDGERHRAQPAQFARGHSRLRRTAAT